MSWGSTAWTCAILSSRARSRFGLARTGRPLGRRGWKARSRSDKGKAVGETEEAPEVSSFEELGAEQTGGSRSTRRGELLLGLLLLLIVIGLGGWTWWQGEGLHAAYRAGDQAATAHHWDDARAAFLAAGDYPNAKARAAAAGAQIVERDKQYTLALTALAKHDGVG